MLTISNCTLYSSSTEPAICVQPLDTLPCPTPTCVDEDEDYETEEESDMQVAVSTNNDEARYHLLSRLQSTFWDLDHDLQTQFHINKEQPENVKQAKEWLAAGNYIFIDKTEEDLDYPYWKDFFRWGKEKPDQKSYKAAREALTNAKTAAEDIIMVKTDEDARLKALNDFQSWTYTN